MKLKYIFMLMLVFSIGYCEYWNVDNDPNSVPSLEDTYNAETDEFLVQSSGLTKGFVQAVSKPLNSVRAFFTSVNNWFGEAIFVGRVTAWFSIILLLQIVFVLFWIMFAKILIRLVTAIVIIMKADDIVGTIKDKHGNAISKSKNKIYDILQLLRTVI